MVLLATSIKALLSLLLPDHYQAFRKTYIDIKNRINNKFKLKGEGNEISILGNLNKVTFDIVGDRNKIFINSGTKINGVSFYIRGSNHQIVIGSNCCFYQGGSIWIEDSECRLVIGERTSIEEAHIALTEPGSSIEIGNDCMFAYDIDIRCGDSHSIIDLSTGQRMNYAKDIIINDHVWLAAHTRILKGVRIGDNSVVATGSIVTKDIPSHSIAAGVPAKVVKTNISWERQRIYDN